MSTHLDRIVTHLAPEPAPELSDGARELMYEIMAGEPAPARSRRRPRPLTLRAGVPAIALLAAAVVALSWGLPSGTGPAQAAALDIKREGDHYIIEIKDLYAAPERYEAQLRAAGLDITLQVAPSTAALEGQVFPTAPDHRYITEITGIYPPGPCDKLSGCAIGVKIPVGFKGTADITVDRKAKPGERYQSTTSFAAKGEPLHCVPYYNKTVDQVRALLKERGVTISTFVINDLKTKNSDYKEATSVPGSWYVRGGSLHEAGRTMVIAHETKVSPEKAERLRAKAMRGCPG
ncbi:hypothetical protein [Nonomuraea glycinis]|uniref:hypothetical protein n=1 Tax=Nonomuraea glycinis TaxID=2047744 RepID=UPI0033A3A1B4